MRKGVRDEKSPLFTLLLVGAPVSYVTLGLMCA